MTIFATLLKSVETTWADIPFFCNRVHFYDGEHVRTLHGTEGFTADTPTEGERHTLRYFPLLHRRKRQQPPRPPKCLYQRKQQSHGDACLERIRTSVSFLGAGGAGHQHLLAQLLPGGRTLSFLWYNCLCPSVNDQKESTKVIKKKKKNYWKLANGKQTLLLRCDSTESI